MLDLQRYWQAIPTNRWKVSHTSLPDLQRINPLDPTRATGSGEEFTMRTIWKYRLEITKFQEIQIPLNGEIISVGLDPDNDLCVWARVEKSNTDKETAAVCIVGTGGDAEVRRELDDMRRQRDEAFQLSKCQCGTDEACRNLYQKQATIARLTKALETIEQWKAFPVIMHRGQTSSYATAYGSNGERDYMRSIARQALNPSP